MGPVRALLLILVLGNGMAHAQVGSQTTVDIGLGGNIVVGAWNPVRLVTRDVPAGTNLLISIDNGSLRLGPLPLELTLAVPGGAGVSVVEAIVYISEFSSLSWSLRAPDAVLASGSLAGREQDARPLDLVLSRDPGRYLAAFGSGTRVVDVAPAALPIEVAAYDGVRTLIVDGTTTAPRLEAVAAAAAAGATVVLHGDLPPSHRELLLLTAGSTTPVRLGAGVVITTAGAAGDAVAAALTTPVSDVAALLATLVKTPLVERTPGPPQPLVLVATGLFGLLALVMMRWFAGPGIVGAIGLAVLLSFVAWRAFRPATAQLTGSARLALVGGALATTTEVREVLTLPAATVRAPATARPLLPQRYTVDASGARFAVPRWRSVTLLLAPVVTDAALRLEGADLVNASSSPLHDVTIVGLGPQPDIGPGASSPIVAAEDGPLPAAYRDLVPLLPKGTVVALSRCDVGCTVWVAPHLVDDLAGAL